MWCFQSLTLDLVFTLRECVEKLQELNNPTFRAEKVKARPEIVADPHMDPSYDSDDDGGDGGESDSMTGNLFRVLIQHWYKFKHEII